MYSRHIDFERILNFRDLGGYRTEDGRAVAWRRLFRSGELHVMTESDIIKLREEIKLSTVIDLRTSGTIELFGIGPIDEVGAKYYNFPISIVIDSDNDEEKQFSNSGEVYLYRVKNKGYSKRIIRALEIIAEPENHPLVFHCNAGKDRSGILAAILLEVLGVADEDVIKDYALTALAIDEFDNRWLNDPRIAETIKSIPMFQRVVSPESMEFFLSGLKKEYGSVRGYLQAQGAKVELFDQLEQALLV